MAHAFHILLSEEMRQPNAVVYSEFSELLATKPHWTDCLRIFWTIQKQKALTARKSIIPFDVIGVQILSV